MIAIRPLTTADLPFGLFLSRQAGWNQTPRDWQRWLALQPDGCFVAEWAGRPAATVTTCLFGRVAWVAMVLVEQSWRRKGIARALMQRALAFLDATGAVATVRLDATPLGQPLYEQLGFVPQYRLDRYAGVLPANEEPPHPGIATASAEQWEVLAELDAAITQTDRQKFLLRLFAEQPDQVRMVVDSGALQGFMTVRPGARAVQLGPCLGQAGRLLLEDACRRHAGQFVYLDVPAGNRPAIEFAQSRGLTVQRSFLRMCRGEAVQEQVDLLWASSGPENG
jgi:GNAT superfamily N-acetyltransferase